MEVLLALPQDVHDRALQNLTTARESEEGCRSGRSVVRTKGYPLDQLFNVEYLVHWGSVVVG